MVIHLLDYGSAMSAKSGKDNPRTSRVVNHLASKGSHAVSEILGMPQSKISNMLRGNFRGISESKMLECLNLLGRDIQIIIKKAPRSHSTGHTNVIFA
jgi:hypothetical protein